MNINVGVGFWLGPAVSLSALAPQNLTATVAIGVDLAWDAVAGVVGYQVDRSTDCVTWTTVGSPVPNAYNDATAVAGIYYYRVRACLTSAGPPSKTVVASISGAPLLDFTTIVDSQYLGAV